MKIFPSLQFVRPQIVRGKRISQSGNGWRVFLAITGRSPFSQMENPMMIPLLFVAQEPIPAGDFRFFPGYRTARQSGTNRSQLV